MPLGAARLAFLARSSVAAAVARDAQPIDFINQAKIEETQNKFGGTAAQFDGVDDVIAIGDDSDSNYVLWPRTGTFTVELWARPADTSFQQLVTVYGAVGDANPAGRTWIGISGNKWTFSGNGGPTISSSANASTTTFTHLAVVRNGSNQFEFFVDGVSQGTATSTYTIAAGYVSLAANGNAYGLDYEGYIDEFRISDSVRYTGNFTPQTAPHINDDNTLCLLHMNGFDNQQSTTDDNGKGRARTNLPILFGGELDTAQSKFGTASWHNDSEYDGFQCTDESPFDGITANEPFTIEMFVRRDTNVSQDQHLIDGHNQWSIVYDDVNDTLEYRADNANTTRITGGSLALNTWYHIAVSRDSSNNTKMFIDGTQTGSTYTNDDRSWANIQAIYAGIGSSAQESWRGHIDELRISNVQRYSSNFTAPSAAFENDADTLLLLHFNGTDGSTIIEDDNGVY